ncbi:Integral membrane protein [Bacillus sp. SG-1]|nr:Integral membrane protein [Bacillus sp. SG-1]
MELNTTNKRGNTQVKWYFKSIKNYLYFEGRARRKEYWMFTLINFLIFWILEFIENYKGWRTLLSGLYGLFIILPVVAVNVRRLHDIGRSGWWMLIGLVPVFGPIALFVLAFMDSEEGSNQYGPNPKYS